MDSDEGQRGAGALKGRRLYFSPNGGEEAEIDGA